MSGPTELLHFAGAVLLMSFLLLWDQVFSLAGGCDPVAKQVSVSGCVGPVTADSTRAILLGLALLGGVLVCWRVMRVARGDGDHLPRFLWAVALLALGVVVYVGAWLKAQSIKDLPGPSQPFLGLVVTPSILIVILLVIAISATGWRRGVRLWISVPLAAISLLACAAAVVWHGTPWVALAGSLVAVLATILQVWFGLRGRRSRRRGLGPVDALHESWKGAAPTVIMIAALGAAMALGSLLVAGFWSWISMPAPGECTDCSKLWRILDKSPDAVARRGPDLPHLYAEFGLALLVVAVIAALLFGAVALSLLAARRGFILAAGGPADTGKRLPDVPASTVANARSFAGLMHRAEPAGLAIVIAFAFALVTSILGAAFNLATRPGSGVDLAQLGHALNFPQLLASLPGAAGTVVAAAAIALVTAVANSAARTTDRPLGLLWDLICFLPRSAHPFGPPCYSERIVPEVVQRTREWQDSSPGRPPAPVILSAHSLGAVLAVASLFAMKSQGMDVSRVALLTYGAQLRAYFGRFFPELLGPAVLGVQPTRGPSLFWTDPWVREFRDDLAVPDRKSTEIPLWINLWRRTDFLGFPVNSFGGVLSGPRTGRARDDFPGIDRPATEWEPNTKLLAVATHNNYPATPEYAEALDDLIRAVSRRR